MTEWGFQTTIWLCNWMSEVCDVIFNIVGEQRLLHGHNLRVEMMELVIQCWLSLENNTSQIKANS